MTSAAEIADSLDNARRIKPGEWMACCPAHHDRNPSLSISDGDDGRLLLHCHAGCEYTSIVAAIPALNGDARPRRMNGKVPRALAATEATQRPIWEYAAHLTGMVNMRPERICHRCRGKPSKVWPYRDAEGLLLFHIARFDRVDGGKDILPFTLWNKGGSSRPKWRWKAAPAPRPLYGLNVLAAKPDANVIIVEGEKTADAARLLLPACVVVTWPGGSSATKHADWIPLKGRKVVIVPDADEPGIKAAEAIARILNDIASGIRIVDPPEDATQGWDLADALTEGWTPERTRAFIKEHMRAPGAEETQPKPPLPEPPQTGSTGDTIEEKLSRLSMSDTGNAKRLIARHGRDLIFIPESRWHGWDGRRFERDDAGKTVIAAQDTARRIFDECRYLLDSDASEARAKWGIRSQDRNRIMSMLAMAEPHLARRHDDLDANRQLLNCMNGTVDLKTAELRPHRRQDLITRLAPIEYDSAAQCPTWHRFLGEIFGANPDADPAGSEAHELIAFLKRAAGYSLTGSTADHVLFICWGKGRNGKSTLLNTLSFVLGDYAANATTDTFLVKDRGAGGISNDIARLAGARFVTAIESGSGRRLDEALVKQTTAGDTVTARFLHREFFEFRPQFKLWLATNYQPDVRGTDRAIWSRILLVPFKETFFKADDPERPTGAKIVDRDMEAKLRREAPGILRWAVEGAISWHREGLNPPAMVRAAVKEYRQSQDVVGEFIESRCILGDGVRERASTLFTRYMEWAAANAAPELTAQTFGRRLGERGLKRVIAGNRFWQGIELQPKFKGQMI